MQVWYFCFHYSFSLVYFFNVQFGVGSIYRDITYNITKTAAKHKSDFEIRFRFRFTSFI